MIESKRRLGSLMLGTVVLFGLIGLLINPEHCYALGLGDDDIAKGAYDFVKDKIAKNAGAMAISGAGVFMLIAGFGEKIKGLVGNYAGYLATVVGVTAATPLVLEAAGYML